MVIAAALAVVADVHASPALATSTSTSTPSAGASATGTTITFPYQQRRLLYSRNAAGGLAYVSTGAAGRGSLPVVVFLHGMNADEVVHPWFGSAHGDLRTTVESLIAAGQLPPLVVAAPTHTRYATGATVMWPRFDLDDFLDATDAALGETAKVDRARVVVVGHSAAGCNPSGGILAESVRRRRPLAVLDVDGCADERVAAALGETAAVTPVRVFWQRSWARPFHEVEAACQACKVEEVDVQGAANPHLAILPEALRRALPALLR